MKDLNEKAPGAQQTIEDSRDDRYPYRR
jgi:hypothetical protein